MSAGGIHRSASPSPNPSPSVSPRPSLQPSAYHSHSQLCAAKDGSAPIRNGSVSPSAESLRSSSLLQIPPPPPLPPPSSARPRSSSSTLSLQHSSRSSHSSVHVPHLPPPPRPLSSPSLSTLVTAQTTPQLSSRALARQHEQHEQQQQILRKYSDHNRLSVSSTLSATALRVDNNVQKKSSGGVVTSLVEKERLFLAVDCGADADNAQGGAPHVHFLQKERGRKQEGALGSLTSRERYLACVAGILFLACIAFVIVAFTRDSHYKDQTRNICMSSTCVSTAAQLLAGMDVSADPCEDFYQYACGQWDKRHIIPEDKHSYNIFEKLDDELQIVLKQLLEEDETARDSNATLKAKTLYRSCLNTTQINHFGDAPLRLLTGQLGGWPIVSQDWDSDGFQLETVLAKLHLHFDAQILIYCFIDADDKNSSSNIIQLDEPGLGLPDREYYLKAKSESEFVQAYLNFMRGIVQLMGTPEHSVENQLLDLLEFETKLANVTRPRAERHDTGTRYNKMTIASLQQLVPQLDWLQYLRSAISPSLTMEERVVVFAVDYLHDMMDIVQHTDKRTVANYVIWRVVMDLAPELSDKYQDVDSQYKMVLHGVKRSHVRWRKCVKYVRDSMSMAVGAMYVKDNFRQQSKDTALKMIQDIRNAFNELLEENQWMDDRTRAVARQKANAMNAFIGYPDFIIEPSKLDQLYGRLTVEEGHYFKNILAIKGFDAATKMSKLGKPVENTAWEKGPAEVNALYSPNSNDIVFPAAILQPLFYSEHFPKSLNYGGIGVVIGHEITHGFDDKGRQYDLNGNLAQWWDNATIEAFKVRAQCMVHQYSSYKLDQTGHYINGEHTQGENIADNGGLKQAYRAYRSWVAKHGEEQQLPGIGLSHDQLFFLNFAQIWCGKVRDEEALLTLRTSVHSPGPIRVLGPLSNSLDFAKAYNCRQGSRMNPAHKCSVW